MTGEEQSQEHAPFFTKNSFQQAKQSIPHTTVMYYGGCTKMCEGFAPNFGGVAS
jgi:hypothetical protein